MTDDLQALRDEWNGYDEWVNVSGSAEEDMHILSSEVITAAKLIEALEATLQRAEAANRDLSARLQAAEGALASLEVYEVWWAEYDDVSTIGIYSNAAAAKATIHALVLEYNAQAEEDEQMSVRPADLPTYLDRQWNHRAGVKLHKVLAAPSQQDAGEQEAGG